MVVTKAKESRRLILSLLLLLLFYCEMILCYSTFLTKGRIENTVTFKIIVVNYTVKIINCEEN